MPLEEYKKSENRTENFSVFKPWFENCTAIDPLMTSKKPDRTDRMSLVTCGRRTLYKCM